MLLQGKTHWIKEGLSLPKMSQQSCSESTKYNRSDWEWLPKPGSREGIPSVYVPLRLLWGFPSACNVRELGSISGLGRSPGEEKGYPLQYSGLENSMNCIVDGVAKSQTQLSDFHFHFHAQSSYCLILLSIVSAEPSLCWLIFSCASHFYTQYK